MEKLYWFSFFVAVNGLILVALAANVSILRLKNKVSYGDGGNKPLLKAIRTHANGMEQVPIFALLLLGLEYTNLNPVYLAALAIVFTVARVFHAAGMLYSIRILRQMGAGATYLLQIAGGLILLVMANL